MYPSLAIYAAFGLFSAGLLVALAWHVAVAGLHHSSKAFAVFCAACAACALADALALFGPTEAWSQFWIVNVRGSVVCIAIAFWIWFCSDYTLAPGSVTGRRLIIVYLALALVFVAIFWLPFREHLIYSFEFELSKFLWHPVERNPGPLRVPHLVFGLSASVLGLAMLVVFLFRAGPDSRWQILLVLLGTGLVVLVSLLSAFGYLGSPAMDKSVYAMPIMVLLLSIACFRFGFSKSSPILLRALMTAIPHPIFVLDRNGHLVEANASGLQLLSQESLAPGKPVTLPIPDVRAILGRGSEFSNFFFTDFLGMRTVKLSDAHPCVMNGERIPLAGRRGRTGDTLIILSDETEHQQLVDDLQQYARFVAHELKNPLTSMMALAEVLYKQLPEEQTRQITGGMLASGERMRQIIQELLLASIPQPGMQDLEAVDVLTITERVADRVQSESLTADIELATPGPWPAVWGRSTWIEQILSNLIENAVEHGGNGAVRIFARTEGQHLSISIVDSGKSTAFQSSQYLSTTGLPTREWSAKRGMGLYPRGLGLTVVRHLVEKSGGTMGIESPRQHSTTAWFTLPLAGNEAQGGPPR